MPDITCQRAAAGDLSSCDSRCRQSLSSRLANRESHELLDAGLSAGLLGSFGKHLCHRLGIVLDERLLQQAVVAVELLEFAFDNTVNNLRRLVLDLGSVDGLLFLDHLSALKRTLYKKKVQKMLAEKKK